MSKEVRKLLEAAERFKSGKLIESFDPEISDSKEWELYYDVLDHAQGLAGSFTPGIRTLKKAAMEKNIEVDLKKLIDFTVDDVFGNWLDNIADEGADPAMDAVITRLNRLAKKYKLDSDELQQYYSKQLKGAPEKYVPQDDEIEMMAPIGDDDEEDSIHKWV